MIKANDVIDLLANAYFAKLSALDEPKERKVMGMKKVRNVFSRQKNKQIVYELINLMLQPENEKLCMNNVYDPLLKGESHRVKVHISTGMGLEIPIDKQIEILEFIDSTNFRPSDFCLAFSKKINTKIKEVV